MTRRDFVAAALAAGAAACAARRQRVNDSGSSLIRLGASTACLAGFSLLEAIQQLARLGFGAIEIISYTGARHSVGEIPGFSYTASSAEERDLVFQATRSFRHVSAHLPFQDIAPFSSSARDRQIALERLRSALDGLAYLKGSLAVMHIGSPEPGKRYRDIWQLMIDTLRMLGDYAANRNVRIGIETMQPNSVSEYVDLIGATDHRFVGATIDTGHIRGAVDIGLPAERRPTDEGRARFNNVLNRLVSTLADKVLHFHLSDVRAADWVDHKTIGSGIVDFPQLFATLRKIGYRNRFIFELEEANRLEALEQSKAHIAPLLARL